MKSGTIFKLANVSTDKEICYLIVKDAGIADIDHIVVKFKPLSRKMKFDTKWGNNLIQLSLGTFIQYIKEEKINEIDEAERAKILLSGVEI